jgi:WD40 repeat protein
LSDAQIADELIALLREAVRQGVVTAVIALSSEYMSRLLDNRELADALRNNTLLLGPMSKAEMRRAIIEPARRQQVRFEPTLVDQLVDAVGRDRGRLPLLQFALDRLWKTAMTSASGGDVAEMTITVEMYQQIGQLEGALARHADSVLAALGREMAGVVRRVLMQMVEPVGSAGETRRTVRRRSLSDQQWEVVRRLADARLVVTRRSAGGDVVAELIHEALIRYWGRLEQWLIEDRAFRLWLARMRGALNQWEVSQRDDGALLRGAPLVEAELWLDTRRDDIPAHLFDFVTAALQRRAVEEIQQEQSHLRERAYLLTLRAELALAVGQTDEAVAAAWAASVFAEPDPLADMVLSRAAYAPGTVRVYRAHKSRVLGLTLDERRNIVVSAAADCTVAVWQLHHGTLLGQHQLHNAPVCCVSLAPNGEIALSGDTSGRLCLWQVDTGRILQQWDGHTGAISDVAWLPDGQRAISASADTIYIWDVLNGVRVGKLLGHSGSLNCLALSGDGKLLLSGGEDHHVRLWDVAARRPVQLLAGHTNMLPLQPQTHGHFSPVMGVCFLQNGKQALSVGIDRQLCVWDLERGVADAIFQLDVNLVSVGVLPGGCHCAVGSTDNQILLVELATGEIIARLNGHTGRAERVLALQDGRHILSAATDGSVRLWDSMHGALLHRYHDVVHKLPVVAVDVTADGRVGVFCYADGTLARWNGEQDVIEQRWQGHDDLTMACRISPDGRLLATGSGDVFAKPLDSSVRVWELATGRQLHRFEGHTRHVWEVAWLPDMQAVVSGSEDGTVRLWSLADGSQRVLHDVSPQLVKGIDVSPDGRSLLIGQAQGRSYDPCFDLLLVDIATGETVRRLVGHQETVYAVRFSADGRCALSGGNDKVVRLWDVATGDCLQALQGHHHQIVALAYHPNGRLAASGSHDCSVIVWDLERGIALRRFDGHTNAVWGVQFIDEGRQLLSADEDGVFCRWRLDADTAALQSWIRQNRWLPTIDQ